MRFTKELVATLLVVVLGLLLLNPFNIFMSAMLLMSICGLLLAAVALFVGLIVTEGVKDEREEKHRASAGRVGYLLGLSVLAVGIAFQILSHVPIDPWLVVALIVMVGGKIGARVYTRLYE